MLGLTRKDWASLSPVLLLFALVSVFRSGASGFIDPDEAFYALTAKEMMVQKEWVTPLLFGQPQFEKPIFSYWVYRVLFERLGLHEWAARLGPALAGLGTLAATAVMARALFGRVRVVWMSAAILAASGLFITLGRVVLTDMFLCLWTTAAFASFVSGWKNPAARPAAWRLLFVWMGLGFLTKGPLGVLLPLGSIAVYAASVPGERIWRSLPWKSGTLLFLAAALPWYAAAAARHDWFLSHFFLHENVRRFFVAEHASLNTPYFYPLVLLFGFFPWSFPLVSALASQAGRIGKGVMRLRSSRRFLLGSSAVIFLFFSSAGSKLISYIFPVFPLLAVLTADWLDRLIPALRRRSGLPLPRALAASFILGWAVLPAALVGAVVWYERDHDLGLWKEIICAGSLAVLPCAAACFLALRRRLRAALAVVGGMSVLFSMAAFGWILPLAERYYSSRPMVEDFKHEGFDPKKGTLLASKMSVRGVSYYADNPRMAVVTGKPKRLFYTPHPLPMISTLEDLKKLPAGDYPMYGLLRPKDIRHLQSVLSDEYSLQILDANPQRSIVRLERHDL